MSNAPHYEIDRHFRAAEEPAAREPVRIGGWAFRGLLNLPVAWDADC
jgi:hypothetical protein